MGLAPCWRIVRGQRERREGNGPRARAVNEGIEDGRGEEGRRRKHGPRLLSRGLLVRENEKSECSSGFRYPLADSQQPKHARNPRVGYLNRRWRWLLVLVQVQVSWKGDQNRTRPRSPGPTVRT